MQRVGRGDVHEVNGRVVKQVLVGAEGFGEVELFCLLLCDFEVAGGDAVEDDGGVGFGWVYYLFVSLLYGHRVYDRVMEGLLPAASI